MEDVRFDINEEERIGFDCIKANILTFEGLLYRLVFFIEKINGPRFYYKYLVLLYNFGSVCLLTLGPRIPWLFVLEIKYLLYIPLSNLVNCLLVQVGITTYFDISRAFLLFHATPVVITGCNVCLKLLSYPWKDTNL
ncbi:hypothetical protein FCM35_KLT05028 [Carex littledalei]|uniref:Uncharacterized protein n=1 Tax=Carex littledalei TaxID=544730 RepID=A0A833V9D3_9POAL|nr:hypothetical protein FCM35_KLT05028 [Carex littledalei]